MKSFTVHAVPGTWRASSSRVSERAKRSSRARSSARLSMVTWARGTISSPTLAESRARPSGCAPARADEHRLKEAVVQAVNVLEADCAHQLGDLRHRDRKIAAPEDRGGVR